MKYAWHVSYGLLFIIAVSALVVSVVAYQDVERLHNPGLHLRLQHQPDLHVNGNRVDGTKVLETVTDDRIGDLQRTAASGGFFFPKWVKVTSSHISVSSRDHSKWYNPHWVFEVTETRKMSDLVIGIQYANKAPGAPTLEGELAGIKFYDHHGYKWTKSGLLGGNLRPVPIPVGSPIWDWGGKSNKGVAQYAFWRDDTSDFYPTTHGSFQVGVAYTLDTDMLLTNPKLSHGDYRFPHIRIPTTV